MAIRGTDFPDANFLDSDGDGIDGNGVGPIYVSELVGSDSNPGTISLPMKTVQAAILRSKFLQEIDADLGATAVYRRPVYVARTTFTYQESLVVGDWIPGLYGGYNQDFTARSATRTRFGKDRPVQMHIVGTTSFEQDFAFQSLAFEGVFIGLGFPPGSHGVGIVVHGLITGGIGFQNVAVASPQGANGSGTTTPAGAGQAGSNGADGAQWVQGGTAAGGAGGAGANLGGRGGNSDQFNPGINAESGLAGLGPSGGSGGLGGARGNGVTIVATGGVSGTNGSPGATGTDGSRAASLVVLAGGNGTDGAPGSGGGGGGGGGIFDSGVGSAWSGGGGGGGGAAGFGGKGGAGGIRGGSSIAFLSNQTTFLRMQDVGLVAGDGGTGGAGQPGGNGGSGGSGGAGGSGLFLNSLEYSGNGGNGGSGGSGGRGGHGAGGNGGSSYSFVARNGTQGVYSNRTLTFGTGGVGGSSSGLAGLNGAAAAQAFGTFEVPVFPFDELRTHGTLVCVNSAVGQSTATGSPKITEPRPGITEPYTLLSVGATSAQGGTVTQVGNTYQYRVPGTFTGMDSFTYQVQRESDGQIANGVCAVYVPTVNLYEIIPSTHLGPRSGFTGVAEFYEGDRVVRRQPLVTNGDGKVFVLKPIGTGLVDFRIKIGHWLSIRTTRNVGAGGQIGFEIFDLVNGDIDGDDSITIFDYIDLSESFMLSTGDAGFKPFADLDGDGEVTIFDYIILSGNFGLEGPTGP